MALTNFVDGTTKVVASWLNQIDVFVNTLFNGATTAAQARTALGVSATGADTTYNVKTANLSDVANAATARGNLGAAASGLATASGLTQSTAKMLGRTTAGTGAIEEITVGTGLSLSAGSLTATTASTVTVPVRQCVLANSADTNGLPSPTVTSGVGTTTLTLSTAVVATAASGFNTNGAVDVVGQSSALSWTGLSTNGVMYLGVKILNGSLTTFSTTVAPTYQWGGTPSTAANAFTFNIQTMQNYLGNGSTADSTQNAVIVGEVLVAAGVISTITWYALMGRYLSALNSTWTTSSLVSFSDNLGQPYADVELWGVCQSNIDATSGLVTGARIRVMSTEGSSASPRGGASNIRADRNTSKFIIPPQGVTAPSIGGSWNTTTNATMFLQAAVTRSW